MRALKIFLTILVIFIIIVILYLATMNNPPDWTGFGKSEIDDKVSHAKTLWDWLDLLIIPVALGLIGWAYSEIEKVKSQNKEEERKQNDLLESFLETMTKLLMEHDLQSNPSQQTIAIARARINVAFNNLNGQRKGQILQFLYESDLIELKPKLLLLGANLQNSILDEIVLGKSEINGAFFNNSSIQRANLKGAIFIGCDFSQVNFTNSILENANLSYSNLSNSQLKNVDLTSVNLEGANLNGANLEGSKILKTQLESIFQKEKIKLTKTNVL
jgi:uncharacterized protein YjbI with pentapeptide repeats